MWGPNRVWPGSGLVLFPGFTVLALGPGLEAYYYYYYYYYYHRTGISDETIYMYIYKI